MKKHLLPLALLFSGISPAQALDVGDISSFMNSDSSTLSKTIQNSTDSGRLINIRLERLSSPLDDGQVMRWNIGRHADGNTGGAVKQNVWQTGR